MCGTLLNQDSKGRLRFLLIAATILLFSMLGAREIWTQEHRWADIVAGMFYRHDFFHPYLGENQYYDKPLLSYWLMAGLAWLEGQLNTWALRAPSALAGVLAVWSIYRLGSKLRNQQMGLLASWMLLTTFYFIFWARTSSADMLNMAGSLFAVSWYFDKREEAVFFDFAIFFLILAVTALCKGLVGAIVALIAIFPDLLLGHRWKQYLRISVALSVIPAAVIYFLPFWVSTHFGGDAYGESGLYLVYRENILRYFQPFDHKGPIYTYLIYLPIYLLPWTLFFIPALVSLKSRWRAMTVGSRWIIWALLLLFIFFSLSGSRRSYYVLPMVPFAILITADWVTENIKWFVWAKRFAMIFFIIFLVNFGVLQPLYYADGGVSEFAGRLKQEVARQQPWPKWQFVMLDPEVKVGFYLQLPPSVKDYDVIGSRQNQTISSLKSAWPVLKERNKNVIFISRLQYQSALSELLGNDYQLISSQPSWGERFLNIKNQNLPIAFVPK